MLRLTRLQQLALSARADGEEATRVKDDNLHFYGILGRQLRWHWQMNNLFYLILE
jgi:hypothetical protein